MGDDPLLVGFDLNDEFPKLALIVFIMLKLIEVIVVVLSCLLSYSVKIGIIIIKLKQVNLSLLMHQIRSVAFLFIS